MSRPVCVMAIDAEDGKHILVVACLDPVEGYASKDTKHVGRICGGQFIPEAKAEVLTEREQSRVVRAWFALRTALGAFYENP